jgi:hypothetical protein
MRQDEKRDPGLRLLGLIFGAVALWGASYVTASRMINHSSASAKFRAAGVVIGVLGFLFWQLATAKLILLHDAPHPSDCPRHSVRGHLAFRLHH